MSQNFDFKFNRMRESASGANDSDETLPDDKSIIEGHTRNLSFVVNGSYRIFLSYAYLISAEYNADDSTIICNFTSHKITIKGINLETLYYKLLDQTIRQIAALDSRYNDLFENDNIKVNVISLSKIQTMN